MQNPIEVEKNGLTGEEANSLLIVWEKRNNRLSLSHVR